jgi:hypothetical protein
MSSKFRQRSGLPAPFAFRAVVMAAVAPLSVALLANGGCATSSDERPEPDPASTSLPPSLDAATTDVSDGDRGRDAGTVPCTVGHVCRVESPFSLGYITVIHGRSKNDVWAAGSRGFLMRWDGRQWLELDSAIDDTLDSMFLTPNEMYGTAGTRVVRRGLDLTSVQSITIPAYYQALSGIAAPSGGELYLAYNFGASFWGPSTTPDTLAQISNFDVDTIVTAPAPRAHDTGHEMQINTRALVLVPEKALWLVGDRATIARYPLPGATAGTVYPVDSQADLTSAWAHGEELWAAGANGTVVHFDGTTWKVENAGSTATLHAIFGFAPNDIWAAGDNATVVHFDGRGWSQIEVSGYEGQLRAIWGATPDDIWFGGEGGLLHWGALP